LKAQPSGFLAGRRAGATPTLAWSSRVALLASTGLFALVAAQPAAAQTATWTGVINDDWDTAGNWINGVIPTAAHTVIVNSSNPFPVIGAGVNGQASHVFVGQDAAGGNAIYILGGGTLTSASNNGNLIGLDVGSNGEILVNGAGSLWTSAGLIIAGVEGRGVVFVTGGGRIDSAGALLGFAAGSTSLVNLNGAGSQWINSGAFGAGISGSALAFVSSGAYLENTDGVIGAESGASGTVFVTDAHWLNSGTLFVGLNGEGSLEIAGGGIVDSQNTVIGGGGGSTGRTTVSGAGSQLNAANQLHVGFNGIGQLRVEDNGSVTTGGNAVIGSNDAGAIGEVMVDNATINVGGGLFVGSTGTGSLEIGAGSAVNVAGAVSVASLPGAPGRLLFTGGTLTAAATAINSAGWLGGSGALISPTTVYGTVSPGNSIGSLAIFGAYTQEPGSTYVVEGNSAGQSDLIMINGTATLNGGTVQFVPFPDFALATPYTILTATGGVTGTFDEPTAMSIFLSPTLTYDPNNVFLTLSALDFVTAAMTPNQIATAGGAQSLGSGNAVYDAVLLLGTQQEAQAAFDALSGEAHVSVRTALVDDSHFLRDAATSRIRAAFAAPAATAAPVLAYGHHGRELVPADVDRFAVWGQGFGAWGRLESDGNAAPLDRTTGGFFVGGDMEVAENWRLGITAGYSRSGFIVADRSSSGSSDSFHLGLYGGGKVGALGLRFGGAHSWHAISTARTVAFPGFADALSASYGAATTQIFAEAGYEIETARARFEPFAGVAYVHQRSNGFTETGGAAALISPSSAIGTVFSTLGIRAETDFRMGGLAARVHGSLGWRHAFGASALSSSFSFAGGSSFNISGVPIARDAAVIEAGLSVDISRNTSLGVAYSGQIGSGSTRSSSPWDC
jgi:outer membrane autotransporter protein